MVAFVSFDLIDELIADRRASLERARTDCDERGVRMTENEIARLEALKA